MEVEDYVAIGFYKYKFIFGNVDWKSEKRVKIIDIPRRMYDEPNSRNRISWILSRYRYLDSKHYYNTKYSFYCHKTGIDLGFQANHTKSTLTKYKNKLAIYVKGWQPSLWCLEIEQDEKYRNAIEKINSKTFELRILEADLEKEKKLLETVETV